MKTAPMEPQIADARQDYASHPQWAKDIVDVYDEAQQKASLAAIHYSDQSRKFRAALERIAGEECFEEVPGADSNEERGRYTLPARTEWFRAIARTVLQETSMAAFRRQQAVIASQRRLECAAPALLAACKALLRRAEIETCQHEETHRGGVLWTICSRCGAKWADDEGGFPGYQEPAEFEQARAAIAAAEGIQT